jgi:hypothetical protein
VSEKVRSCDKARGGCKIILVGFVKKKAQMANGFQKIMLVGYTKKKDSYLVDFKKVIIVASIEKKLKPNNKSRIKKLLV